MYEISVELLKLGYVHLDFWTYVTSVGGYVIIMMALMGLHLLQHIDLVNEFVNESIDSFAGKTIYIDLSDHSIRPTFLPGGRGIALLMLPALIPYSAYILIFYLLLTSVRSLYLNITSVVKRLIKYKDEKMDISTHLQNEVKRRNLNITIVEYGPNECILKIMKK